MAAGLERSLIVATDVIVAPNVIVILSEGKDL